MPRRGRRYAREFLLTVLFEAASTGKAYRPLVGARGEDENVGDDELAYAHRVGDAIDERAQEIDKMIANAAPQWPLDQLSKIDLSVMRIAIAEIIVESVPVAVGIDEAVRLAKLYGGESSGSFVNGALGTIARTMDMSAPAARAE